MKSGFEESKRTVIMYGNTGFECYSANYAFHQKNGENISISFSAFSKKAENPCLSAETEAEVRRQIRLYSHAEEMLEMLESIGTVDFYAYGLESLCRCVRGENYNKKMLTRA